MFAHIDGLANDAKQLFDEIAQLSGDGRGITRSAFGEQETLAGKTIGAFARREGLEFEVDLAGNFRYILPGRTSDQKILIGSHLDSVPVGGNYDGLAGVVAGTIVQAACLRAGFAPAKHLETIAFRCEESPWFGTAYIGSKLALGLLGPGNVDTLTRFDTQMTLAWHLRNVGAASANEIYKGRLRPESVHAYLELHIEQGSLLEHRGEPFAIATAIRGNIRHPFARCRGRYDHSAASPRHLRSDAMTATANLIAAADRFWAEELRDDTNDDLIINFGIVATDPEQHAMTKVPGEVRFTFNVGGTRDHVMEHLLARVMHEARRIEKEFRVDFEWGPRVGTQGTMLDPNVIKTGKAAAVRCGTVPVELPTVGHDAAMFAAVGVPTGMIIVRNQNGSHNPDEDMRLDDFMEATRVLAAWALEL